MSLEQTTHCKYSRNGGMHGIELPTANAYRRLRASFQDCRHTADHVRESAARAPALADRRGLTIGVLGGSFNPAHGGHVHISMHAIKNLALDELWWMVSPCNPLKPLAANVPVHKRLERAASTVSHPRILVTDIEARFGTMYTVDTLRKLSMRRSGINVIWLMGSDCLVQMHLWKDWKRIFEAVPICVFSRPGELPRARNSVAARTFEASRMQQSEAARLGQMEPPAWVFATIPLHAGSSTEFRRVNGPLEHL